MGGQRHFEFRPPGLRPFVWLLLLCLQPAAALPAAARNAAPADHGFGAPNDPVVYEVTAIDGKLLHLLPGGDERLAAGERLAGGAELRTGWLSSADLAVPHAAARFHLESRTHARLGADDPSILLVLDRGRLRALFDKLGELVDGEQRERRVETPSAILAVRGTSYGVAAGRNGATTLVVFEGVVEVTPLPALTGPPGSLEPIRVRAGEAIHLRQGQPPGPPARHGLTPRDWDRGAMPAMSEPPRGGASPGRSADPTDQGQQGQQGPPGSGQGPGSPPESSPRQGPQGPPPDSAGSALGQQGPAQPPGQAPAESPGAQPSPAPSPTPSPSPAPGPAPGPSPGPAGGPPPSGPPSTPPGPPPNTPTGPPPGDTDPLA